MTTIKEVREALLAEAQSTETMVAGADAGVRYTPEYLRTLAASLDGMVLVEAKDDRALLLAEVKRLRELCGRAADLSYIGWVESSGYEEGCDCEDCTAARKCLALVAELKEASK